MIPLSLKSYAHLFTFISQEFENVTHKMCMILSLGTCLPCINLANKQSGAWLQNGREETNGSVCGTGPGPGSQVWEKEEDMPLGPGFALAASMSWSGPGLLPYPLAFGCSPCGHEG